MPKAIRQLTAAAFIFVLTASLLFAWGGRRDQPKSFEKQQTLPERQRAIHALNRLSFGPRPGDLERVLAIGVDRWIEQQLNPDKIDDSALNARLAGLHAWKMSTEELIETFPPRPLIRAIAEGKRPMPQLSGDERLIYETAIRRYREQIENRPVQFPNSERPGNVPATVNPPAATVNPDTGQEREQARQRATELAALKPEDRLRAIARLSAPELATLNRLAPMEKAHLVADLSPQQHETMFAVISPELAVTHELQEAKLLRTIYSERQLQEVMTDFWMNHFNVFLDKGLDRYLLISYERDVIRPRALVKFRDLLVATAQSPAMLWYLDNWESAGPNSPVGRGEAPFTFRRHRMRLPASGASPKLPRGLNENYARELLELHTLGVNGGYTQADVTELARVLTGWSIQPPVLLRQSTSDRSSALEHPGSFIFRPRMHEPGSKVVLGKTFKENGEKEGLQVLDMLARHPSTARHICDKLAERFVSDNPPAALVERMTETFRKSDGDIRKVLRTMFRSPEFWAPENYRAKVKTPLEFVASAIRATGSELQTAQPLIQALNRMGMPPYGSQPPTGYSMKAEAWVNSAALLDRMNFGLALGAGRLPGIRTAMDELFPPQHAETGRPGAPTSDSLANAGATQSMLEQALLQGDVSPQTHEAIASRIANPQAGGAHDGSAPPEKPRAVPIGPARASRSGIIAGLLLGSPEFQRR